MLTRRFIKRFSIVALVLCVGLCSCEKKETRTSAKVKRAPVAGGFYGWDSLMLRNMYVRLDVVPDLGGKIMGYDMLGYQVLWHDTAKEGFVDTGQGYGFGERFFNPGGAKVWPAPQGWSGEGEWPGPPDDVLDGSAYEYDYDESSITVISPRDDAPGRSGLQFRHTYSIVNSSSILDLNLSMTNIVDRPVRWGLWHIATVPVDRQCTVYAPVNDGDWSVMFGAEDNPQWLGVENGLFRARYDKRVGKVGLKVREGWLAWHDEENNIVYAMLFPVKKGAEYPDGGSNVEIWTSGAGTIHANNEDFTSDYTLETAMMELEIMGPLTRLSPGKTASMDVKWGVCRCSGIKRVIPAGVIVEELEYDGEKITGKFGVFQGGDLQAIYIGKDGGMISRRNLMGTSPLSEVIISIPHDKLVTLKAETIRFQVISNDKQHTAVIGEVPLH